MKEVDFSLICGSNKIDEKERSSPVTFISFLLWSANQKTMRERPIKGRALSYLRDGTFSFIQAPWISSLFGIGISFFTGLGPCLPNNLSTYGARRFHISRSEWDRVFSRLTVVPGLSFFPIDEQEGKDHYHYWILWLAPGYVSFLWTLRHQWKQASPLCWLPLSPFFDWIKGQHSSPARGAEDSFRYHSTTFRLKLTD